ncbi:hypothetical protein AAE026_31295 [Bradyrhizobium sp. DN5]
MTAAFAAFFSEKVGLYIELRRLVGYAFKQVGTLRAFVANRATRLAAI